MPLHALLRTRMRIHWFWILSSRKSFIDPSDVKHHWHWGSPKLRSKRRKTQISGDWQPTYVLLVSEASLFIKRRAWPLGPKKAIGENMCITWSTLVAHVLTTVRKIWSTKPTMHAFTRIATHEDAHSLILNSFLSQVLHRSKRREAPLTLGIAQTKKQASKNTNLRRLTTHT